MTNTTAKTTTAAELETLAAHLADEAETQENGVKLAEESGTRNDSLIDIIAEAAAESRAAIESGDFTGCYVPFRVLPTGSRFKVSQLRFRDFTFEKVGPERARLVRSGTRVFYTMNPTGMATIVSTPRA